MKIKITFDPDGVYGYQKDEIISGKQLVEDYIETLNEVEDADTISFLKTSETEKAVDFVAEMWGLDYDVIPDDKVIRKCSVCGREMTEGYVFDGTDCFCSYDCAAEFFNGDRGCVEILLDEGERLIWMDSLPTAPHYRVNIGYADVNNFHYCDTRQKVCNWLSERLKMKIETQQNINDYNRNHKSRRIDFIVFEPKEYYKNRKPYIEEVRKCEDIMTKAQMSRRNEKIKRNLRKFSIHYDNANDLWDMYPEVWQGEI